MKMFELFGLSSGTFVFEVLKVALVFSGFGRSLVVIMVLGSDFARPRSRAPREARPL